MNLEEQKRDAGLILERIRGALGLHEDSICIAGGAPRNWEHGEVANDLDVYIRFSDLQEPLLETLNTKSQVRRHVERKLQGLPIGYLRELGSPTDYVVGEGLVCVLECELWGEKVQFMIFNNETTSSDFSASQEITDYFQGTRDSFIDDVLVSFDVNLCKVAMRTDGSIIRTPEFKTDKANRTLTMEAWRFNPESHNVDLRENHHLQKLLTYYPDYNLIMERRND